MIKKIYIWIIAPLAVLLIDIFALVSMNWYSPSMFTGAYWVPPLFELYVLKSFVVPLITLILFSHWGRSQKESQKTFLRFGLFFSGVLVATFLIDNFLVEWLFLHLRTFSATPLNSLGTELSFLTVSVLRFIWILLLVSVVIVRAHIRRLRTISFVVICGSVLSIILASLLPLLLFRILKTSFEGFPHITTDVMSLLLVFCFSAQLGQILRIEKKPIGLLVWFAYLMLLSGLRTVLDLLSAFPRPFLSDADQLSGKISFWLTSPQFSVIIAVSSFLLCCFFFFRRREPSLFILESNELSDSQSETGITGCSEKK
ncbi:MAG: hypothetical protein IKS35_07550 [Clostridia bacterium]|nr:hypothetical protein [Clostridia bacterium]